MPYFTQDQPRDERACKVFADIFVGVLLLIFSVVFFGPLGGVLAFLILEAALIGVDYMVPSTDDAPGNVIR
jgi:hypothetical protein